MFDFSKKCKWHKFKTVLTSVLTKMLTSLTFSHIICIDIRNVLISRQYQNHNYSIDPKILFSLLKHKSNVLLLIDSGF